MNFVGVHDTQTLVSYLMARPRRLTLTSSSTLASRAFLSHWWMRNKAQMFKCHLLVLVMTDLMVWKRWHHEGIFKNPAKVFDVLLLSFFPSFFLYCFIPFRFMGRVHIGATTLNETCEHSYVSILGYLGSALLLPCLHIYVFLQSTSLYFIIGRTRLVMSFCSRLKCLQANNTDILTPAQ